MSVGLREKITRDMGILPVRYARYGSDARVMAMVWLGALVALVFSIGGCNSSSPDVKPQTLATAPAPSVNSKDPAPAMTMLVQMDVYQLTVPAGVVSRNDALWKHVSEENLDVVSRDVLFLNGIRVGVAPSTEWGFIQGLIDAAGASSQKTTCLAGDGRPLEMSMKKDIRDQCIFISNPPRDPEGRSYEECENLIALTFWPEARHAGDVRVKICPLVRGTRKRLETTVLDGEREFKFVSPEHLYDLKLDANVPLNNFLVIAPSECAKTRTTVGNAFLLKDGASERQEQVLVMVPRVSALMTAGARK